MTGNNSFIVYGDGCVEEGFETNEFTFPIKSIVELTELERCISQSRDVYKSFVS